MTLYFSSRPICLFHLCMWTQASKMKSLAFVLDEGQELVSPRVAEWNHLGHRTVESVGCHIQSICCDQLHLTGFLAWAFLTNQKLKLNLLLAAIVSFLKIPWRHSPPYSTEKPLWKLPFADSFIKYLLNIYLGVMYHKIVQICCFLKIYVFVLLL